MLPEAPGDAALREAAARAAPGMALILDFVGHDDAVAERLRRMLPASSAVIDVGACGLAALLALLRSQAG